MLSLVVESTGVAVITFNDPESKVNTLTMSCMQQFSAYLDDVRSNSKIRVLILKSTKKGVFIAGADIKEIQTIKDPQEALKLVLKGQSILNQLSALSIPTIALIDGVCLGGGLELALACDYRVASLGNHTQLGLPEVQLGIIPGFGGTQRLSRLIGISAALSMILPGKSVDAKKALKLGLVDQCFYSAFEDESLRSFVDDILTKLGKKAVLNKRKRTLVSRFLDAFFVFRAFVGMVARRKLRLKTKGRYPAPEKALKAVLSGYGMTLSKGLRLEAALFASCLETSLSGHLINIFFSQEKQKKTSVEGVVPNSVRQAAVVGAGLMGSGIAWSFLHRDISVVLKDVSVEDLSRGTKAIYKIFNELKQKRRLKPRDLSLKMHGLTSVLEYDLLRSSEFVVEAVPEQLELKQAVYSDIESIVSDQTIIATNTSSLSVQTLSEHLRHPDRFIGMHFFSPVNRMPLVEVVPTTQTSDIALATTLGMIKKMKKMPVVVKDCPGFLVNRVFLPYVNEAMHCLVDGASILDVDRALLSFGMPMGPLALADNVGLDVGMKVLNVLEAGYGDRMKLPNFAQSLQDEKRWLGKKSGKGFYVYSQDGSEGINRELLSVLKSFQLNSTEKLSSNDIVHRCVFMMINEAARCLEENVVENVRQLDFAMIFGTGFPPFLGGLCAYADEIGLSVVIERLDYFSRVYGERFKPCNYLVSLSEKEGCFYLKGGKK